jgi:hypothetical protein
LTVGYALLIFGSFVEVLRGTSIGKYEFYSQVQRHQGLFLRIHVFAYVLLCFSFLYGLILTHAKIEQRCWRVGLLLSYAVSLFCLYKTYTRTAFVGLCLFWLTYFCGRKRTFLFAYLIAVLSIGVICHGTIENIFWKTADRSLDAASSGRLTLWKHNLALFSDFSFEKKMMGAGLGNEVKTVIGAEDDIWSSHSNLMGLLMGVGILGLMLYCVIICMLLKDIYMSRIEKGRKFVFYGIIFAVMAMNSISNAFVFRIECSQLFWLFMGLFYVDREMNDSHSLGR